MPERRAEASPITPPDAAAVCPLHAEPCEGTGSKALVEVVKLLARQAAREYYRDQCKGAYSPDR